MRGGWVFRWLAKRSDAVVGVYLQISRGVWTTERFLGCANGRKVPRYQWACIVADRDVFGFSRISHFLDNSETRWWNEYGVGSEVVHMCVGQVLIHYGYFIDH